MTEKNTIVNQQYRDIAIDDAHEIALSEKPYRDAACLAISLVEAEKQAYAKGKANKSAASFWGFRNITTKDGIVLRHNNLRIRGLTAMADRASDEVYDKLFRADSVGVDGSASQLDMPKVSSDAVTKPVSTRELFLFANQSIIDISSRALKNYIGLRLGDDYRSMSPENIRLSIYEASRRLDEAVSPKKSSRRVLPPNKPQVDKLPQDGIYADILATVAKTQENQPVELLSAPIKKDKIPVIAREIVESEAHRLFANSGLLPRIGDNHLKTFWPDNVRRHFSEIFDKFSGRVTYFKIVKLPIAKFYNEFIETTENNAEIDGENILRLRFMFGLKSTGRPGQHAHLDTTIYIRHSNEGPLLCATSRKTDRESGARYLKELDRAAKIAGASVGPDRASLSLVHRANKPTGARPLSSDGF